MDSNDSVVLLTADRETEHAVALILGAAPEWGRPAVCSTVAQMVRRLEHSDACVSLVDIDPDPARVISEISPVISRFARVSFVVLSKESQADLILRALQAGARYYQMKQSMSQDLLPALQRLAPSSRQSPAQRSRRGEMLTILSASGGCGATTLAINLANEIALSAGSPSLVVDMDCAYGAIGPCLGVSGQYGLAEVLSRQGHVDAELVSTTSVKHSPSLHVLLSPASIGRFASRQSYDRLPDMLEAIRGAYSYTVIDAPRVPMEVAVTLAMASRTTLLVLQLNVKDLVVSRSLLAELGRGGVKTGGILAVVNRYHKRTQLVGMEEAQKVLGIPIVRIGNDFASATRCLNFGQTLAKAAPRSLLRRDLQKLASKLAALRVPGAGEEAGRT